MNIASYIDHTLLKPTATGADVELLCKEALEYKFAAVCVPPYYIREAKKLLGDSGVKVATVVGFPFGYSSVASKLGEIADAMASGADELDVVHNIAALKSGDWAYLEKEIKMCTNAAHAAGKQIKVIVESGMLSDEQLVKCCELYGALAIDFMKTSTGFADVGATVHAVKMMREHLPAAVKIKASGGIRDRALAVKLIDAGADRLGCSASVEIVSGDQ